MAEVLPAYLLLGPESGQKNEFIDELRKKIRSSSGEKPEEYKFYCFETRIPDIVSIARNGSLFTPHKLIIYSGIEDLKKKDEIALLSEYLAKPSPEATIVLISDSIQIDQKLEKAAGGKAKKIFWELFDNQKSSWIASFFSKEGLSIRNDASDLLLEMVENDTHDIRKECEKLVLFFEKGTTITPEDIEKYIYHSKEENAFTLFEHLIRLQFESSLEILNKILLSKDSNPVQILSGLLWQWRKLLALKILLENNYNPEDAFLKIDMKGKRQQKLYAQASKNFSSSDLEKILERTCETDVRLRSTKSELHNHLLLMYVYGTVKKKGSPLELPVF